ncbi:hypothetical protein K2173_005741 [Erythroxylum novogranatense]|uniref:Uncharacterized protein n=1 Tax=Erythroxylum novogranatense TaxID=1862640 RepID=A0AAV8U5A7_9ROSI|nr:hypothetical protein K2173_005741 [Erythroxylum novogranatense]
MATREFTSVIIIFFLTSTLFSCQFHRSFAQNWIKASCWYASSDFPKSDINSALFTHLLCGFATVNSTTYDLSFASTFQESFSIFTDTVKLKNPSIVTLLSIWNGQAQTYQSIIGKPANSSVLSSMLLNSSYRKAFIESSIRTARLYGFQRIDLFWLWPNSTYLFSIRVLLDEWRAAVVSEPRNSTMSQLILTMGVCYSPSLQIVTHVVAYDYYIPAVENFTCNHAALYSLSRTISSDSGIREWLSKGFPANKLLLGLPYHGYAWTLVKPGDNSVGARASGLAVTRDGSMGYRFIKSFIQNYGYGARPVHNSTYVVNYFFVGSIWINYDDVETIMAKISYAKGNGLGGYNVFQVINDDNWAFSLAAQGERSRGKGRGIFLKVLLPITAFIMLSASIIYYYQSRARKQKDISHFLFVFNTLMVLEDRSAIQELSLMAAGNLDNNVPRLQIFSFAMVKANTNNFSTANKLGEGGFGPVYKGTLPWGKEIAVKRLSESSTQGLGELKNEVSLTVRLQHVNLVRLLGFCTEDEEKMLVYEFMPKRSLDLYLFGLSSALL